MRYTVLDLKHGKLGYLFLIFQIVNKEHLSASAALSGVVIHG